MIRHVLWTCPCGASVIFGDLATEADIEAWGAEHLAHAVVHLEAPVWEDTVLGLSVLQFAPVFPLLRGRSVALRFFGRPGKATTEALLADLAAAGATVLGVEGGWTSLDDLPPYPPPTEGTAP